MPRIQDQVADNRRDVQRLNSRFIFVPERQEQNLSFGQNLIETAVSINVYTRPLNGGLTSGHPEPEYGSGRGVAGDLRGDWTLQEDVAASAEWTRGGRNAVRDALAGETGSAETTAVGTGTGAAAPSDTSLQAETATSPASGIRDGEAYNAVRTRSSFRFTAAGDGGEPLREYGLFDATGRLLARVTTDPLPVSRDAEVRVDLTLTVTGSGNGTSVITDAGETAVADSLRSDAEVVGLDEIAWGTGTAAPDAGDTALASEVFRATAQRITDFEVLTVSAPQFESQPSGQPYSYTEVGVFDNEGRLVWRTTLDGFTKNEDIRFTTAVGFKLV
jgi:hypothetical protein